MSDCQHVNLIFEPSVHAVEAGFERSTPETLSAAVQQDNNAVQIPGRSRNAEYSGVGKSSTFPQPLVLPGDELAWDPDYDPQTLQSWIEEPERNEMTKSQRTLYVVDVPSVSKSCREVKDWTNPILNGVAMSDVPKPKAEDVRSYLEAFYHPLQIKPLPKIRLEFVPWTDNPSSYIGLKIGSSEVVGIRHRSSKDGFFSGQLNLDDLLDAAMSFLPNDGYALLMLVDHDLYEDEDDDFCCGRAYGGSRVAVVSSARYNPGLDEVSDVERKHAWPASHCEEYCGGMKKTKKGKKAEEHGDGAMHAAVKAFTTARQSGASLSMEALSTLWLSRVGKTASHELGHCFGLDHCVFYACIMQGTAGLAEDARQPPYLCPVDLAKVLRATKANEKERYEKLRDFCDLWAKREGGWMWAAWEAWLEIRLREVTA